MERSNKSTREVRNYGQERRMGQRKGGILAGIGRIGGTVARELTKPGPQQDKRAPGSSYTGWKGRASGMDTQELLKRARRGFGGLPAVEQKMLEVELETLSRKDRSKFVTPKKLQAQQKRMEQLFGAKEVATIMESFDMQNQNGPMSKGMMSGKNAAEHIRRLNLPEHTKKLASYFVGGLDQGSLPSGQRGMREDQFGTWRQSVEARYGKHVAEKIGEPFGPSGSGQAPESTAGAGLNSMAKR
jgi:hypothetical protein